MGPPKCIIQRAPIMSGLTLASSGVLKPFIRPKLGRRAYKGQENEALRRSSLGPRRSFGGLERIMSRAGKGLNFVSMRQKAKNGSGTEDESDSEEEKEEERPFEPLMVWQSPHQGGEARGLPKTMVTELQTDEYGVEETVTVFKSAPIERYSRHNVFVPPVLAKWLRPHQREGVEFMYQCVMGLKDYHGSGCILADDMGLGKTLQSVALIYTLLKTGVTVGGKATAKRIIVVCPCSLVKNWDNEFVKWLGPGAVKTLALAEADRKKIERDLDSFAKTSIFQILICSYECLRTHVGRLTKYKDCCDVLVCDEAHRLKNNENQTSRALDSIPVKRRVLLTGTPMQNGKQLFVAVVRSVLIPFVFHSLDLNEFYAMVNFTNPGVLGTQEEFRKDILYPVLRGREPDATERQKQKMIEIQQEMSSTVNEFILRRVNTLNAQHLPPKLVQVVCCNLTEIQNNMYSHLVASKDMQHVMDGKQVNCLGSIQMLMKLCNHPSLVAEDDKKKGANQKGKRRAATKQVSYTDGDENNYAAPGADGISKFLPFSDGGGRGNNGPVHPEWSGKMFVLYRLMKEMRRPGNGNDKIVIISNYTTCLDLIGRMCRENSWGFCRLDGSVTMKKRQKMVDEFNDPSSSLVAFLLSSKAGGCGLNLIGGNRLVLFDPDWNPAVDKQAAARCWRDGQKKRCFTYRFLATGTVEEKIFQRQLSKEGLQSIVDDKEQVNALSTKDLRNLFKLRTGTPSDTHDKLKCERCKIIHDNAELEAKKVLPKQLAACQELISKMSQEEDAKHFLQPLDPTAYNVSKEDYEKAVKQPMDLGTIQKRLSLPLDQAQAYKNTATVSKDVNRIFNNVMKVWSPGEDEIADATQRLQSWWMGQWQILVPILMSMKPDAETADDEGEAKAPESGDVETCTAIQNERGDDYQEQIGMPEEENMRDWSHHHTTDTLDDPIFRAAMRGYDSVSFTFALEVTWSKIQQKQQEEEDRKALEELQAFQEMQEENDEEQEDDGDNSETPETVKDDAIEMEVDKNEAKDDGNRTKKAVPAQKADQEEEEMEIDEAAAKKEMEDFIVDDSEDEKDSVEAKEAEDDEDDDSLGEEVVAAVTVDSSEESSGESSPEKSCSSSSSGSVAEVAEAEPLSSASPSAGSTQEAEIVNSPGEESTGVVEASSEWQCAHCTFMNPLSRKTCSICKKRRSTSSSAKKSTGTKRRRAM
ncbi:MAG: hypothetical protein SGILL_003346 [Bacillariaceae sp.]